ncbi:hypothetical protein [Nocardia sp. CNY236]|uniref:hypothetical protein n=1 Tax=Nocardia sp. CNY236 TaxID=1169152 RepID=UPI00042903B7|nr:hypothetical protein [Nocardia sp. CNY236]
MRNRYPSRCRNCGDIVNPGEGTAERAADSTWVVEHPDCSPRQHNPMGAATWTIRLGEGAGGGPSRPGRSFRANWTSGDNRPGADEVPGGRTDGQLTSGIVTTVTAGQIYYNEDGLSFGVGADTGYVYWAEVRAATADEAAPILDSEDRYQRRMALSARIDALIGSLVPVTSDREYPETAAGLDEITTLPQVPTGGRNDYCDRIHIDEPRERLWLLINNSGDGDDWNRNIIPERIVCWMPYTADRRQLVADLRDEYDIEDWLREGVAPAAAQVLAAAGWSPLTPPLQITAFDLTTADDAETLLQHSPQQWLESGWGTRPSTFIDPHRFPPSHAARLMAAGIDQRRADQLYRAGHHTVEDLLSATPPTVPSNATRIILRNKRHGRTIEAQVTCDPVLAREYLAANPARWGAEIHADTDVRIVHAETVSWNKGWAACDDGSLVLAPWLEVLHYDEATNTTTRHSAEQPKAFARAAAEAITLMLGARWGVAPERSLWHPLRAATAHYTEDIDNRTSRGGTSWSAVTLTKHTFTLADNSVVWWQVTEEGGGVYGGEGDVWEYYLLYTTETDAREAYRNPTRRP